MSMYEAWDPDTDVLPPELTYMETHYYDKGSRVEHPKFLKRYGTVVVTYANGTADVLWDNSTRPYGAYEPGELNLVDAPPLHS